MLDCSLARETVLIAKNKIFWAGQMFVRRGVRCKERLLSALASAQCPRLPAGVKEGETFPLHLAAASVCGWKVSLSSLTLLGDLSKIFERGGTISFLEGSFLCWLSSL